jgi:pentatricopeptide repeat protein
MRPTPTVAGGRIIVFRALHSLSHLTKRHGAPVLQPIRWHTTTTTTLVLNCPSHLHHDNNKSECRCRRRRRRRHRCGDCHQSLFYRPTMAYHTSYNYYAGDDPSSTTNIPIRESILSLLKDPIAYPPGTLTLSLIEDAERALESWASSTTKRRTRNSNRNNNSFVDNDNRLLAFENAVFLLTRLLEEQYECHRRQSAHTADDSSRSDEDDAFDNNDVDIHNGKNNRHNSNIQPYSVRPFLLNRIVDHWRISWTDEGLADDRTTDDDDDRSTSSNVNKDLNVMSPADMINWIDRLDEQNMSLSSSSSFSSQMPLSDSRTWTLIVDALCRRGDPFEAPLVAQWLLDRQLDMVRTHHQDKAEAGDCYEIEYHRDHSDGGVNQSSSSTTIMQQQQQQQDEDHRIRPDTVFITNVIRAWAKSGRLEAPEMAEGLLRLMYDLHENGWTDSGPNTMTYGVVMDAWYRSQHPEASHRLEALLEEMKSSHIADDVVPDRVCYQYVLNSWARDHGKSRHGVEKAHQVLREMISLYRHAGNDYVAPNASNFSTVMMAACRVGDADRAEKLYEQLQDLHQTTGNRSFRPTVECRKALLLAKAKSGAAHEAQCLIDELVKLALSDKRNQHLMPNRSFFVDVLVAWTKHKDDVVAAERAQNVLNQMVDLAMNKGHRYLLPDKQSFDKVILAWSRSRQSSAPGQIEQLMTEMKRLGGRPTLPTYTNLMLAYLRSPRGGFANKIQLIFDDLSSRCSSGEDDVCPDCYVYGIVIDAWGEEGNITKVEQLFRAMLDDWKSGNQRSRPDLGVFLKVLKACSRVSVEKCNEYMGLMKDVGLPLTVGAHTYLLHAMMSHGSSKTKSDILRVVDEVLDEVATGRINVPSFKEYRSFLQAVAHSNIHNRSQQAKERLQCLTIGRVPRELLPLNNAKSDAVSANIS